MSTTLILKPSGEVETIQTDEQADDWFYKVVIEVEDALRRAPPPPESVVIQLVWPPPEAA